MEASLPSPSDLMLTSEGFQKHNDRFTKRYVCAKMLYATSDDCLSESGSATAAQNCLSSDYQDNVSLCESKFIDQKLGWDSMLPLEDGPSDTVTPDLLGIVEREGIEENAKRLQWIRSALAGPLETPCTDRYFHKLPDSSRDSGHIGDLCWHNCYQMRNLSETMLPPMRYTSCGPTGLQCFHRPYPMLQIFNIKVKTHMPVGSRPIEIYGFVAVRDAEDYRRNYLFNRSRNDSLVINPTSDYLHLMSPSRGISMTFDCLIEIDIRMKGEIEDQTVVDGCTELIEGCTPFDRRFKCNMDGTNGFAIFDLIVFQEALEATIELAFLKVPSGGFEVKMCGYTTVSENVYSFIDDMCECDNFITSTGKYPKYFIAAVPKDDMLLLDFMEERQPVPFKATVHGSQKREYHFNNKAIVSIKVSWSTIYY